MLKVHVLKNVIHIIRQTQMLKAGFFWQIKCVGPEQIKGFDQVGDKGLRLTLNNTHARHCWSAPLDALRMPS